MIDYYAYPTPDLVKMLGRRFKQYRQRAGMTQRDVAEYADISLATVQKFESGASDNISLNRLLQMLRAIGFLECLDEFLPELPPSPYLMTRSGQPTQRIHKSKRQ